MSECGRTRERAFLACGVCNRRPQPSPPRRPLPVSPAWDPSLPAPSPPRALPAPGAHPARQEPRAPGVAASCDSFQPWPPEERGFGAARRPPPGRALHPEVLAGRAQACVAGRRVASSSVSPSITCLRWGARAGLNLGGPSSLQAWTEGFRNVPWRLKRAARGTTDWRSGGHSGRSLLSFVLSCLTPFGNFCPFADWGFSRVTRGNTCNLTLMSLGWLWWVER